ncbi:MAG TPA: alkaline phosphatase family protein, partial [Levilinea sp.]|nr:alkaline phosphatase family protein [Levilinea sp.]
MPGINPELMAELEHNHPFPDLEIGPGLIYPYYDGYSLVNLPGSICDWLGVPRLGAPPLKEELAATLGRSFRHVILVVMDGIGLDRFLDIVQPPGDQAASPAWQRLLPRGTLGALTSIVPSTTSAALTSLWSGRTAVEHGIVGYEVWLKEYGLVANMITHSAAAFLGDSGGLRRAGFQPQSFLPVKTLGVHLAEHGIQPYACMPVSIARSGLSTMQMAAVRIAAYHTLGELWVSLGEQMRIRRANAPSYTYVYWGDLDSLSHRYGPGDERVRVDFESFSLLINYFVESMQGAGRGDTLLIVTADHGHIATYSNPAYELRRHPELLSHLAIPPTGENRLPYLFLKPGREDAIMRYVEK